MCQIACVTWPQLSRMIEVIFKPERSRRSSITAPCVPPWTLDDVLKELHGGHYIFILCGTQNRHQVKSGQSPAGQGCFIASLPFGRFLWIPQPSPFRPCSDPSSAEKQAKWSSWQDKESGGGFGVAVDVIPERISPHVQKGNHLEWWVRCTCPSYHKWMSLSPSFPAGEQRHVQHSWVSG